MMKRQIQNLSHKSCAQNKYLPYLQSHCFESPFSPFPERKVRHSPSKIEFQISIPWIMLQSLIKEALVTAIVLQLHLYEEASR